VLDEFAKGSSGTAGADYSSASPAVEQKQTRRPIPPSGRDSGRVVGKPYLGITSHLPITRAERLWASLRPILSVGPVPGGH
jgi:hypothetical protein